MTRNQLFALAYEVERTLYESSSSWEGIDAQEIPLSEGEVVLRIQPGFAAAMPLRFHPATVETSLAHAIEQVEALVPWCLWVIGPSSQPSDLQQKFIALGFTVRMEWEGLILDDLSLSLPTQEVQIEVARLDREIAGFCVLRIEPNGVAYLRNAMTVPAFRNRGVYLSLVAHRLAVARTMGCTSAVLQAQTVTSAPILIKRGFKPVCRFVGLARKRPASTTSNYEC